MATPPARALVWLIVALIALGTTNYENTQDHDGFHRHGFPALFGGLVVDALPIQTQTFWHDFQATSTNANEDTRAFIESIFSDATPDVFGPSFTAALSDNVVWTVTGNSPITGRYEGIQDYTDNVLTSLREVLVKPAVPILEKIIVDGDSAFVSWTSENSKTKSDASYEKPNLWIIRTEVEKEGEREERKIAEVLEFLIGGS